MGKICDFWPISRCSLLLHCESRCGRLAGRRGSVRTNDDHITADDDNDDQVFVCLSVGRRYIDLPPPLARQDGGPTDRPSAEFINYWVDGRRRAYRVA